MGLMKIIVLELRTERTDVEMTDVSHLSAGTCHQVTWPGVILDWNDCLQTLLCYLNLPTSSVLVTLFHLLLYMTNAALVGSLLN